MKFSLSQVHLRSMGSVAVSLILSGCGTFQLASNSIPLSPKTREQMQIDNLSCKDQAKLAANTAERQAGAFALGFTIVGAPLAFELEKAKQREVYKSCMEARGYRVLPPNDGPASASAAPPPSQLRQTSSNDLGAPVPTVSPATRDEAAQLQKLKELREKGLITEDEYQRKRKQVVDRL